MGFTLSSSSSSSSSTPSSSRPPPLTSAPSGGACLLSVYFFFPAERDGSRINVELRFLPSFLRGLFGQRVCNGEDGHLLKRWGRWGRWGRSGAAAGSSLIEVVHGSAVRLLGSSTSSSSSSSMWIEERRVKLLLRSS